MASARPSSLSGVPSGESTPIRRELFPGEAMEKFGGDISSIIIDPNAVDHDPYLEDGPQLQSQPRDQEPKQAASKWQDADDPQADRSWKLD